jgi:hypothetical protein
MPGTCVNNTGEVIAVYGPRSEVTPSDRDNALYRLPSGRRTPPEWDCDGIFVPSDRIADQFIGSDVPGPVAVKYVSLLTFEITKEGTRYQLPANQGVFNPGEVCCPSDFPKCVCWNIPNIKQAKVLEFPEVPGHLPA